MFSTPARSHIPEGFTYLDDPRIIVELAYLSHNNFVGRPITGYEANVAILTQQATAALIAVQNALDTLDRGYRLKLFDAYRPQQATEDFISWAQDIEDNAMQTVYYPYVPKTKLFDGYISNQSSHTRGSTVDLTIVQTTKDTNQLIELDMGTRFDYFDDHSHTDSSLVSQTAQQNRQLLKSLMEKNGFENYSVEWWHYTLRDEPFPNDYFDFVVR